MRAEATVTGIIQGVGFRPFVYRLAVEHGLVGFVRNRGDAGVDIVVEGDEQSVKSFLESLRVRKPPLARIHTMNVRFGADSSQFRSFSIHGSFNGGDLSGSTIPPDVSICGPCLRELRDEGNRRFNYFFITCTDCGPRYTMVRRAPYDRPNTTMDEFPMCSDCEAEYRDPLNRRFHAQTVACEKCGPRIFLTDSKGKPIGSKDPVREVGRLLDEGYIVAVKGNGGFHIATATTKPNPIIRLRGTKHRTQKPFAIMARSLEAARSFAEVSLEEAELLSSPIKPIVLLRKSENYYLSEEVSPKLHNVGVMLPYTGLHAMLFDRAEEPAFVMTSANPPNEPIIKENDEALRRLGSVVDYFLLHNRKIAHRCDDSVIRVLDGGQSIIRRSRGYAPAPIQLRKLSKICVLGVGGELNSTSCVLLGGRAFISQHVGDVETIQTYQFLRETIEHLVELTKSRVEAVACDLHPRFASTALAKEFAEKLGCDVFPVQHHYAHLKSLMGESGVEEMVGVCCDGFGYGLDGKAWGGEILHCHNNGFQRVGHLEEQPMVGGDLATRYPLRMAAGILDGLVDAEKILLPNVKQLPHGAREAEVIVKQLKQGSNMETTSCGRILDAVSALLGICFERTYEGEPAMKLESTTLGGRDVLKLEPKINGDTVETTNLVYEVYEKRGLFSAGDLAYSAQSYIARSLAQLALEKADELGVKAIGFSGGVAYNGHIAVTMKRIVERNGSSFVTHSQIPPGDGGISFGQAVAASKI